MKSPVTAFLLLALTVALVSPATAGDSKFVPYGYVRAEAFWDDAGARAGDWLLLAPVESSANAENSVFAMTARHTRLGVKLGGTELSSGTVTGLIEIDFAGGFPVSGTAARQAHIRMRHAWIDLGYETYGIRLGQDWALISLPFERSTSFVSGAATGNLYQRFAQAKFYTKGKPLRFAVSINRPTGGDQPYLGWYSGADLDPIGSGEISGLPWLMGRVWMDAGAATFSVSGHYGQEKVADLGGTLRDIDSYSLNADVVLKKGPIKFTTRVFTGSNLVVFFGGALQGYTQFNQKVEEIETMGGWSEVVYSFNDKVSCALGTGVDDPVDDYVPAGGRTRNQLIWGNVAIKPVKPLTFMVEFNHLDTDYKASDDGTNNRVQCVAIYTF